MLFKRAATILLLVAGCGRCGATSAGGGPTPYARCLEADPPTVPPAIGRVTFQVNRSRVLDLKGLPREPRVAVFQGPGMTTALPPAGAIAVLATSKPDLVLIVGGLGNDSRFAGQWLNPIAELGLPILFLAGGRDRQDTFAMARESLPATVADRLIDLTAFSGLRWPGSHWVLVAGSESGRESIADDACGFAESDLADRVEAAKTVPDGTRLTLVSWEIPRGALGRSSEGLPEVGSASLATLSHDLGDIGGLHAWPDTRIMRPSSKTASDWSVPATDLQLVVPRLFGPAHERSDGSRQLPGFVIVTFATAGLIAELPR